MTDQMPTLADMPKPRVWKCANGYYDSEYEAGQISAAIGQVVTPLYAYADLLKAGMIETPRDETEAWDESDAHQVLERLKRELGVNSASEVLREALKRAKRTRDGFEISLVDLTRAAPPSPDPVAKARAEEREAWQPIETAPKDGTILLGAMGDESFPMSFDDRSNDYRFGFKPDVANGYWLKLSVNDSGPCEPTAWMPLPSARSDQDGARRC